MSSEKPTQDQTAKTALAKLISDVEPIIKKNIDSMDGPTVNYILSNYSDYLKLDLRRDFDKAREKNLTESPFDELLNGDFPIK